MSVRPSVCLSVCREFFHVHALNGCVMNLNCIICCGMWMDITATVIIRRHRMWPVATYVTSSVVCLSVCLGHTDVLCKHG